MKKIILIIAAIFLLISFTACSEAQDTPSMIAEDNIDTDAAIPAETEPVEVETDEFYKFPFALESTTPREPLPDIPEEEIVERLSLASWPGYRSFQDLMNDSVLTDVVRARILSERTDRVRMIYTSGPEEDARLIADDMPVFRIHTLHRIQILDVYYSWTELSPGDVIEIGQQGGQIGNERFSLSPGLMPLAPGEDLILFIGSHVGIERKRDPHVALSPETYEIMQHPEWIAHPPGFLNPWQGAYHFPAPDNRMRSLDADDVLETVVNPGEENRITFTIADLAELQIQSFGHLSESFEALLTEEARAEVMAAELAAE